MNRTRYAIAAACCALMLGGCSEDEEPVADQPTVPEFVTQAAEVARAIALKPVAADSILAAHNMTRAGFDSLMYEIAMDPVLTEAFEAARR